MAWFPIANTVPQYWKQAADGTNEYSGAVLKAYQVGTLTNIAFATDNTGGTTANSIALNANGHPEVSGNVVIPHLDQDYKLALYPDQTSADADSGATWTIDNLDLMGFDSGSLSPEHATDSGTDTYDSAVNTSAPDTGTEIVRDFQSTNSTTTPTLDSITLKDRDGNPLWPGAINGAHRLFYDGTDYLVLDLRASSGVVDPEHATDSATDTYVSATNTTPPADGVKITRDFQSANTTTTPTLDGKTMTTRDGSALWAGAVSGVHDVQYDSGADTYLVLEPNPSQQRDLSRLATASLRGDVAAFHDEDDMASDDPNGVASQQSVKAYTDSGDPTLDTEVDATNGGANNISEIDFTGIKAGANRIEIVLYDVSSTGSDQILVQIGDSGGLETSGYTSSAGSMTGAATNVLDFTTSFGVLLGGASEIVKATVTLVRLGGNRWMATHTGRRDTGDIITGSGNKNLSAELDRLRVTLNSTGSFDGGRINILVE